MPPPGAAADPAAAIRTPPTAGPHAILSTATTAFSAMVGRQIWTSLNGSNSSAKRNWSSKPRLSDRRRATAGIGHCPEKPRRLAAADDAVVKGQRQRQDVAEAQSFVIVSCRSAGARVRRSASRSARSAASSAIIISARRFGVSATKARSIGGCPQFPARKPIPRHRVGQPPLPRFCLAHLSRWRRFLHGPAGGFPSARQNCSDVRCAAWR